MAENAVNNEENVNSQSSQLEEEDLQKLEADFVPVNTKKQTSSSLQIRPVKLASFLITPSQTH